VFNVLSITPPGRSLRQDLNLDLLIHSEVTATYRTREFSKSDCLSSGCRTEFSSTASVIHHIDKP
jgi:hypothetical protein